MPRINAHVWPVCILLNLFLSISDAFATYSIIMTQESGLTIGSDSREISSSGINDDTCKIFLIDKNIVFTLVGYRSYYDVEGKELDTLQIVANTTYKGEAIEEYIKKISDRMTEWLNRNSIKADGNVWTQLILAGFDKAGKPEVVVQRVFRNSGDKLFASTGTLTGTKPNQIIPLAHEDETFELLKKYHIQEDASKLDISPQDKHAVVINNIIAKIISERKFVNIGGSPTILRIEYGKPHKWLRKNKNCVD